MGTESGKSDLEGNEKWKCPGHGTMVADESGKTWFMYHAYDSEDSVYVGRQALLDEINWTKDGWATINDGKGPSKQFCFALGIAETNAEYRFYDDFKSDALDYSWHWQHAIVPDYRIEKGWLVLSPKSENAKNEVGAMMAQRMTVGDFAATTELDAKKLEGGAIAGISAYGDNENALGIGYKGGKLIIWKREKGKMETVSATDAPKSSRIHLKMTARDGHLFQFAVSKNGKKWSDVGAEVDGFFLPPWDRAVRIALVAGGTTNANARFGFLRIEPVK